MEHVHLIGIGGSGLSAIARVLLEPDSYIATAVYEDGAALERQESRPEVYKVIAMLPESLAAPLERTIFEASLDPALA